VFEPYKPPLTKSVDPEEVKKAIRRKYKKKTPPGVPPTEEPSVTDGDEPTPEAEVEISPETKRQMLLEYSRTRRVPDWARQQIQIPAEVSAMGMEEEYVRAIFEKQFYETAKYPHGKPEYKFGKRFQERYRELPPREQFEYGMEYGEIKEKPAWEYKQYRGGREYLESLPEKERTELLESTFPALKEGKAWYYGTIPPGDVEKVTGISQMDLMRRASQKYKEKWHGKSIEDITRESEYEMAWESLVYTPEEFKTKVYESYDPFEQAQVSFKGAAISATAWPYSLTQMGVKWATKREDIFGPWDLSKGMRSLRVGPSGLIGVGVSEAVTLGKSEEWETAQKYPLGTAFATVGEVFGLVVGTEGLRAGIQTGVKGIKLGVVKAPKVYGKTSSFFGRGPVLLESGARLPGFGTRVSETAFWRHIYGWGKGSLVRVKTLPLKKTVPYVSKEPGIALKSELRVYRGWGKTEWTAKPVVSQTLRAETFHIHKITPFGRYQAFVKESVIGPKGRLWFKSFKKQITTLTERDQLAKVLGPADTYKGFVRPVSKAPEYTFIGIRPKPGMPNIWKDTGAMQRVVPHVSYRPMISGHGIHAGYLAGPVVSIPSMSFAGLVSSLGYAGGVMGSRVAGALAYKQVPKLDIRFDFKQKFGKITAPSLETARVSALGTEQLQLTGQGLKSNLAQLTQQAQVQLQMTQQQLKTRLASASTTVPVHKPRVRTRGLGKFMIPPIPMLDGSAKPMAREDPGQGFGVWIKDRTYVAGQKRYSERFTRMRVPPLRKETALGLGATLVDRSAAATFYVKPVSGKPKTTRLSINPWSAISGKFYQRGNRFIEHTMHRIDSPGEFKQITAKGILASMKRQARVKPKKVITVDRVYAPEKVFDMKQFRKAMRWGI